MASRFLGRCASLLARSPRSSLAAGHLHPVTAQPEYPPCSQVLIRPSFRTLSLGPGPAQEEETNITFSRTELDVLVEKATTPQEVLSLWTERGGSANQAGMCLVQLSRLMVEKAESDKADLLKDPRCVDLIQMVNSQVTGVWNGTLVSLLRSLSVLGVPLNAAVMRSLQTEALWRLRRFTYRHLCFLADWASGWKSRGQGDEALITAVLKQLELRWTELSDPRMISTLMSRAARRSPPLMDKLEDKALELAERFSAEDIRRVSLALALQSRRAVPLLRALSYHLHQKPSSELNTALLLDIAFSYGKLHFHQTQVFQRMAAELLPRLPDMSSTEVMRCSKSLAFLKWLHLPLFEGFAQHYLNNSDRYSTLQMCNLLMAFAKLNFQPSNKEQFFEKIHEALKSSWQSLEPFLLTDVVWSLCIFQQAKPEYIAAVTDSTFQSKLTDGGGARAANYTLKLLHIATSAQLESGIRASTVLPSLPEKVSKPNQTAVQSSLYKALQVLTENNANVLRTEVNTVYGWTVDAELVVDSDNKPLNLESLEAPHLPGAGGSERLPQGARRMAFLAWEFPHFVSRSKDLLGRFAMQKRHLQLAGFLIVEVPYFEWLELKTDWQRVAYLKDKMGKAVAEDMAK
ncbi:FAST kinase domain-containing protein 4 [Trichomycterus rosablanca]|uniref:FAST kinase domain-containing protein 4 n=1 Tax=Trichomycterus rosablanca TaxID=2290929 RepID=UPI002F3513F6